MTFYKKKWKRQAAVFATAIVSLSTLITSTQAHSLVVTVDNQPITFDNAQPFITSNDWTMIPFRTLTDALDMSIDWDAPYVIAKGTHQHTGAPITVHIQAGSHEMLVNGKLTTLHTPTTLIDGHTYIPLRLFVDLFGYEVDWVDGMVHITTPEDDLSEEPDITFPDLTLPDLEVPDTSSPDLDEPEVPEVPNTNNEASEVLALVNVERVKAGVAPLQADASLDNVARIKSEDMATNNYFSHESPTYGSTYEILKQFGISYRTAGENIAMGYSTPQAVVDGWMNSSGHRTNILNPNYTHMGLGYDENGHYWAQVFAAY